MKANPGAGYWDNAAFIRHTHLAVLRSRREENRSHQSCAGHEKSHTKEEQYCKVQPAKNHLFTLFPVT